MEHLKEIDRKLLHWAYQRPYKHTFIIKALIFMGDGPFWMLLVLAAAILGQALGSEALHRASILLMLGLAIGNLIFTPLKKGVKRRRPYANPGLHRRLDLAITNRDPGHGGKELESFPSGHVMWTTLCAVILSQQFGWPALLLFGWMIPAMMYLRPRLGVHYPSDTLAGLFIGLACAGLALLASGPLLALLQSKSHHGAYLLGYWAFVVLFLIIGFRSWLKRV